MHRTASEIQEQIDALVARLDTETDPEQRAACDEPLMSLDEELAEAMAGGPCPDCDS